jgi:NADPH:quinone reductase-like Zn-dependent oxidoreductase
MKAVVLTAYGDVDKLEYKDLPDPRPGADQIKVRMAGSGLNPVDWKMRSGALQKMMPLELPAVLGRDVSGEVVEVGPGVTAFKVGARVMGLVMGGYAELVVAAVEAWAEVPAKLDLVDAAAIPLVGLTGSQLILEALRPGRADLVLVTGAVGSVGRAAVFTARAAGARVWAGVRKNQVGEAAELGAEGVVALDDSASIERMPQLDGIADTVGGETIAKLLVKVKPGGTIGSVVGSPAGAKERGLVVNAFLAHPDPKRLAELGQAVGEGKLSIPIARRFPLAEAREAQKLAESHVGGKVLLTGSSRAS